MVKKFSSFLFEKYKLKGNRKNKKSKWHSITRKYIPVKNIKNKIGIKILIIILIFLIKKMEK